MMKWIKRFYHFLGGIFFALILITLAVLFVIAGTVLESYTESHLYAAQWTYQHPLFAFLLLGFFINILFAALRRWPFQRRHIPFLMTHLGLLMIIGGTLIKNRYGTQGHLMILEGSESHHLLLPHTFALHLEKRTAPDILVENAPLFHSSKKFFNEVKWNLIGYTPHATEKLETWIKRGTVYFPSLPPFPLQPWQEGDPLIPFTQTRFQSTSESWTIIAIRTRHVKQAIQQVFLQNLKIHLSLPSYPEQFLESSVQNLIPHSLFFANGKLTAILHIDDDPSTIQFVWEPEDEESEQIQLALNGPQALIPTLTSSPWTTHPSLAIDLKRPPTLLIIEDELGDCYFCAFDAYGRLDIRSFRETDLQSVIVYDRGFDGYTVSYPFPVHSFSRKEQEQAYLDGLENQLKTILLTDPLLSPPLILLKKACEQVNQEWTSVFISFLYEWGHFHPLLFSTQHPLRQNWKAAFNAIDWNSISQKERQGCLWTRLLFAHLQQPLKEKEDLIDFLRRQHWPFTHQLHSQMSPSDLLILLAQQLFSLTPHLPTLPFPLNLSASESAQLFSAYLKGYGMDDSLLKETSFSQKESVPLLLEVPLSRRHTNQSPLRKLEHNHPRIVIDMQKGELKESVSLIYDPSATGFKWPILNGNYLIRFQPIVKDIPYRVRLRSARQIHYAHSTQPFSYESDVLITDPQGNQIETTLSMNHVYETWDGYRFYLAGMSANSEAGIKRVQIIVNHDPAKYFLTYPGALGVALGMFLLFWMQPYRKK
jgi:hypothetical protein